MANRAAQLDAEIRQAHQNATVKRRGRNFIEHDMGGGVTRWTGTIEPLHTRAGAAIDTTWVADTAPWSYRIAAADYVARIKATFSSAPLLQYANVETGATVSLQPMALNWTNDLSQIQQIAAVQGVTAELTDDLVRWPGAYGVGRDFEYQNHPKRLIKRLVLQSALTEPAAYILDGGNVVLQLQFLFSWTGATVWIDGAQWDRKTAKATASRIEFRVAGVPIFRFDPPAACGADGEVAPGVVMKLRKAGNNLYVEVRTPYTWLQSAQYPVTVDPTLTLDEGEAGADKDTYISSGNTDRNYGNETIFAFGSGHIGLIKFDLSSIDASNACTSATLSFWNSATKTSNRTLTFNELLSANSDWVEGNGGDPATEGSTWDYKAQTGSGSGTAWAGSAGASTANTDYSSTSIGTMTYTANDAAGTEDTASLTTSVVKTWFGASNSNYGMRINNPGAYPDVHSSDSATAGYRPKIVVEYAAITGSPWYAYAQQ